MILDVLGVDYGGKGAIAVVPINGRGWRTIKFAKATPEEMRRFLSTFNVGAECAAERIGARPGDNRRRLATMMKNRGSLEYMIKSFGITIHSVEAITWQLEFGLGGIETYSKRKRAAVIKAREFYPAATLDDADAILIAEYWRRMINGVLTYGRDKDKAPRQATGIQWELRQQDH